MLKNQRLRLCSAPVDVELTPVNDNGGQWEWSLNKFVWRDGLNPIGQNNSWIEWILDWNWKVDVSACVFGGRKVIEYESRTRSILSQMGIWVAPGTKAYVTKVMPRLSRAQLPPEG